MCYNGGYGLTDEQTSNDSLVEGKGMTWEGVVGGTTLGALIQSERRLGKRNIFKIVTSEFHRVGAQIK